MPENDSDICLGRVFRFCEPTNDPHPKVIASDPIQDPLRVVIVGLSSWPGDGDAGFILEKGDHPMISHASYVRCDFMIVTTAAHLEQQLRNQKISISKCLPAQPLSKVHRSVAGSPRASMESQEILRSQGLIR